MGLFTKKEKVHYERDADGNIVNVERSGNIERRSRTPVSDALLAQQKQQRPSRWEQYKQQKTNEKQMYKEYYEKAKASAIKKRAARDARQRYSTSTLERFGNLASSSQSKGYRKPSRSNANPFGSLFDTGFSSPPTISKKKKSSKKKKGSSRKKKSSDTMMGFDMTDNWGLL